MSEAEVISTPQPEIIPKYVTLLPDYSNITLNYQSYRVGLIIAGAFLILLLILLILFGWYFGNKYQQINYNKFKAAKGLLPAIRRPPNNRPDILEHLSNAVDLHTRKQCLANPHAHWENGECRCDFPYWGSSCQHEAYGKDYIDAGTIKTLYCGFDIIGNAKVENKAFPSDSKDKTCEDLCNDMEKCVGYIYADNSNYNCTLLGDEPVAELTTVPERDGEIYLNRARGLGRPNMGYTVILYSGNLPPKFWLKLDQINDIADIGFNHINRLDFYPESVINDSDAIIVMSTSHFKSNEAKRVVEQYKRSGKLPSQWYVHIPGKNSFMPPFSISKGGCWAMALGKIKCPENTCISSAKNSVSDPRQDCSKTLDYDFNFSSAKSRRDSFDIVNSEDKTHSRTESSESDWTD